MNKTQFYYSFVFYYITIENGRIFTVFTICNLRALSTTFSSRPFLWPINHLELPILYYGSTMFVENVVVYVMFVISQNCGNLVKYHLLYCPQKNATQKIKLHISLLTIIYLPCVQHLYRIYIRILSNMIQNYRSKRQQNVYILYY